jgi:flagellar brake protein
MVSPADKNSPFWLYSKVEIAYTLKYLHGSAALLTAHLEGSKHQFITAILEVSNEADYLMLDAPSDSTLLAQIEKHKGFVLRSNVNGIRVEFRADNSGIAQVQGSSALRVKFPERLLKVQRREYFRVSAPVTRPATCTIPQPDGPAVQCRISDISLGGVALSSKPEETPLPVGATYEGCRLNLQDFGTLEVALLIRYASEIRQDDKLAPRRYGCEFLHLRRAQETAIQRYVLQLERDRGALAKS